MDVDGEQKWVNICPMCGKKYIAGTKTYLKE
jgi:urease beta subunit